MALLYGAVTWRLETGGWDARDLELLVKERDLLGAGEFTELTTANVPADLADELAEAMKP
jgi:hypothetical protein